MTSSTGKRRAAVVALALASALSLTACSSAASKSIFTDAFFKDAEKNGSSGADWSGAESSSPDTWWTDGQTSDGGDQSVPDNSSDVNDQTSDGNWTDWDNNSQQQGTESSSASYDLVTPVDSSSMPLPDNEALKFVRDLKLGWNLGNTFDAVDCTWLSDEMQYESVWNGAMTTEQHIDAIKAAGFRTVRIPVSWHNHLSDRNNYTINKQWLDRVQQVADWCLDRDLYVLINIHHDNSTEFMYPSTQYLDQSKRYVTSIWKQVSERFKNYDERLIFGCMNEPRLVGHGNEWWLDENNPDCRDAVQCINQLNQAIVDTIRASGGKNTSRYILCPGYCASPEGALSDNYKLPNDPKGGKNRLIVSVHAYTPYEFALNKWGTDQWSSSNSWDLENMTGFMDKLYNKYTSKGIPVLIDEFGALKKNDNLAARVDFSAHYVSAARARGISCIWWDNNAFDGDGENFGLLDRSSGQWRYPEIVDALVKNS